MSANQVPAHIARRAAGRSLVGSLVQVLGTTMPPRLSIRANRFRLVDAAGDEKVFDTTYMDVVLVDSNDHLSKLYYEHEFDPNASEYAPPTCFSDNGVGPSRTSAEPQAPNCKVCPHNVWGSAVSNFTGKATKACNDLMKLAFILPDDPGNTVYLAMCPPASLKNLRAYASNLSKHSIPGANRACDVADVVTRFTFDPDTTGVLKFAAVGWIDEYTLNRIEGLAGSEMLDQIVGRTDMVHPGGGAQLSAPSAALPPPPAHLTGGAASPVAFAPAQAQQMAPPPPPPVQEAPAAVAPPPQAAPAPSRRGRPPAAKAEAPAQGLEIPAFLQRTQQAAKPAPVTPQPAAQFGIANAPTPPADVQAAVTAAFALPT